MIRLIMCEGPNELEIMRILIRNDKLIFGEDDLLGLTPYHARQLSNSQVRTELNMYPGNDVLIGCKQPGIYELLVLSTGIHGRLT